MDFYSRKDIKAEPILGASVGCAVLGSLIGALLAGLFGLIPRGRADYIIGTNADDEEEERQRLQRFYEG